jgi:uncharacterized protein
VQGKRKELSTFVFHGGHDSFVEEFYAFLLPLIELGFTVIAFDPGPGRVAARHPLRQDGSRWPRRRTWSGLTSVIHYAHRGPAGELVLGHHRKKTPIMSNLPKIKALFEAYANKNLAAVSAVMAEDIVWRIPGHHPLSSEKYGIKEVLAFFDQLAKANFQAQPLVVAEQGDYVADHHRGWSTVGGGLDLTWCLVFRFEARKIKEVTNFCADQHEADWLRPSSLSSTPPSLTVPQICSFNSSAPKTAMCGRCTAFRVCQSAHLSSLRSSWRSNNVIEYAQPTSSSERKTPDSNK